MTQTATIPREELDKALRRLCKRIGATIVSGMAYRDVDFAHMGMRLEQPEEYVRHCIHDLIEGRTLGLSTISDLAMSLGLDWKFDLIEAHHEN